MQKQAKARYDWCEFEVSIPSVTRRWDGEVFTVYVKDAKSLDTLARIVAGFESHKWILCSDRMPTEEDGDEAGCVAWTENGRRYRTRWDTAIKSFTHWMGNPPLPTLPEES